MLEFLNQTSQFFTRPLLDLLTTFEGLPIATAFILGMIGALAPCQITGNISAIAFYGNKSVTSKYSKNDLLFFVLGKIFVFSALGMLVWIAGNEIKSELTPLFSWSRKLMGPFIILMGVMAAGWIKWNMISRLSNIPIIKKEKAGPFLLGASFSIAFCPTMFILFFGTLMPLVLTSKTGFVLPLIFSLGTSLPFVIIVALIATFSDQGNVLKKSRNIGRKVQISFGIFLIMIGIMDTLTYWI